MITRHIHCTVEPEPQAFHEERTFSINLGVEAVGTGTLGDDEQKEAEEWFKQALEFFGTVSFTLLRWDDQMLIWTDTGTTLQPVPATLDTGGVDAAMGWLQDSSAKWLSSGSNVDEPIEAESAPATYRLRAAQSWSAPVGHSLALTHLVRFSSAANASDHVIVPAPAGGFDLTTLVAAKNPDKSVSLAYEVEGVGAVTVTTAPFLLDNFDPASTVDLAPDVSAEGYLKVDEHAEIIWRMVDWLEKSSGSAFAASTALLDLTRDRSKESAAAARFHFDAIIQKTRDGEATEDKRAAAKSAVVWFCATQMCAALDPLILGLIGPGASSEAPAPGVLIAPFVNALSERVTSDPQLVLDSGTILSATNAVLASRLLSAQAFSPADKLFEWLKGAYPAREEYSHLLFLLQRPTDDVAAFDQAFPNYSAEVVGETIQRELNQIEQMLQDEGGAEEVLLRLLRDDFPDDLAKDPPFAGADAIGEHVGQAWKDYELLINGPFNAAEAARKAASREFARAAMEAAKNFAPPPTDTKERILQVLRDADFFYQRVQEAPAGCFAGIIGAVQRLSFPTKNDFVEALLADLRDAWKEPVKELDDLVRNFGSLATFTPDLSPAPLPIQIAASLSAEDALTFSERFNGIAVGIRRIEQYPSDPAAGWAHANLARLTWKSETKPAGEAAVPHAIDTCYPAVSDGSAPMFLNYEGRPFVMPSAITVAVGARPFYIADLPDSLDTSDGRAFARIPELAYGRRFETFAFVTTNGGTLPRALQASAHLPWIPDSTIAPPDEAFIAKTDCQRRTAIGRTEIIEIVRPGKAKRLGAGIAGVHPLAQDYPEPAPDGEPREPDAGLLLLAPEGDAWRKDAQEAAVFRLSAPRVNFRDFERWFANPDLFKATFAEDPVAGKHLLSILRLIHELRDIDARIGPLIDRMPDPAVHSLQIGLRATGRLTELVLGDPFSEWELAQSLAGFATRSEVKAAIKELTKLFVDGLDSKKLEAVAKIAFEKLLVPLDRHFCAELTVKAGEFGMTSDEKTKQGPFTFLVPAGVVARLSIDAMVSDELFLDKSGHPATIHPGLKRFSRPDASKVFQCFPSAAMQIEVMFDGFKAIAKGLPENLVHKMIGVRPLAGVRSYRIETRARTETNTPAQTKEILTGTEVLIWKLIGEIDVATQRWRPTGRPLYHSIDPTKHIGTKHDLSLQSGAGTAFPIDLTSKVEHFETDAFLDRGDADFLLSPPQKVSSLDSGTILLEQPWTDASATYFRHRFVLRSRYSGAMKPSSVRSVSAWTAEEEATPNAWTHRVAMRAELSRLELTRPQLRALIPLTTAPSATDTVPPVMAVLQERPYDRGGLADLVLSELKTGFGYGFPQASETLALVDSRKEIGPDPRLTYRPLDHAQATGVVLASEGMIGLTFDPVSASAPAFPNSVMLLSPTSLRDVALDLTEHHLAVQLWRTFRPGWVFPLVSSRDLDRLSPSDCWWIEVNATVAYAILKLAKTQDSAERTIVETRSEGAGDGLRSLWVNPRILDPKGAASDTPIIVASWNPAHLEGPLVILHRPAFAGRCLTSIIGTMSASGQKSPAASAPVILASFEWPLPPGAELLVPNNARHRPSVGAPFEEAHKTSASGATSLAWTRTAVDADKVAILTAEGADASVATVDLAGVLSRSSLSFRRSDFPMEESLIVPSLLTSNVPLYVQRHSAVILTSQREGPGRPIEEFVAAALMFGSSNDLEMVASATGLRKPLARIVEIETPAAILCNQSATTVPRTYREAFLDLVSHRPVDVEADWQVRFLLRFNVPWTLAPEGHKLVLQPDQTGESGNLSFDFVPSSAADAAAVRAAEIRIAMAGDKLETLAMRFLDENGKVTSPKLDAKIAAVLSKIEGLRTTMTVRGVDEPVWADLSILWSWRNQKSRSFDFDWLFGPPRALSMAPEREVQPAALAEMREAQARIISMSPPIPVRREPN